MAVDRTTALINSIRASAGRNKYFDPSLGDALVRARRNLADTNRRYSRGVEEASIAYDESARDLLQARDLGYENNTGNMAAQGILRSGIYATEQGKIGENYQRGLTAAAQRKAQTREALVDQRLSGIDSISEGLGSANRAAAQRARDRRQKAAQAKIEAEFRKRQAFMAIQAQNAQKDLLRQQMALASRPIPVGGGGGGGGGQFPLDLAMLLGMGGGGPTKGQMKSQQMGSNAGGGGDYARRTGRTR